MRLHRAPLPLSSLRCAADQPLLRSDGAPDANKSHFLRDHFAKEKAVRVAQWRENEKHLCSGDRSYETMRATRFSDLNRSLRFVGASPGRKRLLSPGRRSRRRSGSPRRSSSYVDDVAQTMPARLQELKAERSALEPAGDAPSPARELGRIHLRQGFGVHKARRGDAGEGYGPALSPDLERVLRDSNMPSPELLQRSVSASPVMSPPADPLADVPVLCAPKHSPKPKPSYNSRRQYDLNPTDLTGAVLRRPPRGNLQPIANPNLLTESQSSFVLPNSYPERIAELLQGPAAHTTQHRRGIKSPHYDLTQYGREAVRKHVDLAKTAH